MYSFRTTPNPRLVSIIDYDEPQIIISDQSLNDLKQEYEEVIEDPAQNPTMDDIVHALSKEAKYGNLPHLIKSYPKLAKICIDEVGPKCAKRIFLRLVEVGGMVG